MNETVTMILPPTRLPRGVVFLGAVWLALTPRALPAQASDFIDMRQLGARGVIFEAPVTGALAVESAGSVGDVNGDGFDDIAVSVPKDLFYIVVYGRPGFSGRHTLRGDFPGSAVFRSAVETGMARADFEGLGDLNEDGFGDFIFSIASYPDEAGSRGRVYLVYGSPALQGELLFDDIGGIIPGVVFSSSDPNHQWMPAVADIGDINGDGQRDLAISAPSSTPGVVFVFLDVSNLPASVDLVDVGGSIPGMLVLCCSGALFGRHIEALGDFDGDGLDDFVVHAGETNTAWLIRGKRDLPAVLDLRDDNVTTITDDLEVGRSLGSVAGVGDLNGDGRGELLLGAFSRHGTSGAAVLILGGTALPKSFAIEDLPLPGVPMLTSGSGWFATEVAGAGDLDGDGVGDFLVSAPRDTAQGRMRAGKVYAIFGRADFPDEVSVSQPFAGIEMQGEETDDWFGYVVGSAGDFNGDGAGDMLAVARQRGSFDSGTFPAKAYVIYGTGSGPVPLTLQGVEPDFGPMRGGKTVTIRGSGFTASVEVRFANRRSGSVTLVSGSQLRVTTPPRALAGKVDVSVTVEGETRILGGAFEYTRNLPEIDLADLGVRGLVLEGDTEEENRIGVSVSFGDLDDDGIDEFIVGNKVGAFWSVSIVRGRSELPSSLPGFESSEYVTLVTSLVPRSLHAVSTIGDVNSDGIDDLGIGCVGVGYVLFGREELAVEIDIDDEVFFGDALRIEHGIGNTSFSFAPAGDPTGDGIADFAVGLPAASLAGEVIWVAGREEWPESLDLAVASNRHSRITASAGESFGEDLLPAGDVNGDGLADLLAPLRSGPPARSYVLYGTTDLPAEAAVEPYIGDGGGIAVDIVNGYENLSGGFNVAAPGDVDGDGFDDLLFGDEGGGEIVNQGVSYLLFGGAKLPSVWSVEEAPEQPDGVVRIFGEGEAFQAGRVGPAGDLDGDGFADLLIGVPGAFDPFREPGRVNVVFGGAFLPGRIDLATLRGAGLRINGRNVLGLISVNADRAGDLNGDGRSDLAFTERGGGGANPPPGIPETEATPGYVHVIYGFPDNVAFIRGDANHDQNLDLTDAVTTLRYLFSAGPVPRCLDGADADDRGTLELTDAVYFLNYLFRGRAAPPPPFPEPGEDPTADKLGCKGF